MRKILSMIITFRCLARQPWFIQYVKHTLYGNLPLTIRLAMIFGINEENSVRTSFLWNRTLEGTRYWSDRSNEFENTVLYEKKKLFKVLRID